MRIILFVIIISLISDLSGQSFKKNDLKGSWVIDNIDSSFYQSDSIVFIKMTNVDKSIPSHHFQNSFIEINPKIRAENFFYLDVKNNKMKVSNVIGDTMHMFHDAIWEIKGKLLKIKSREIDWKFWFIGKMKIKYDYEGKSYDTDGLIFKRTK